jgi:hypothetical protein
MYRPLEVKITAVSSHHPAYPAYRQAGGQAGKAPRNYKFENYLLN